MRFRGFASAVMSCAKTYPTGPRLRRPQLNLRPSRAALFGHQFIASRDSIPDRGGIFALH